MEKTAKKFSKIIKSEFKALGTDIDIQIVVENNKQIIKAKNDLKKILLQYKKFEKIFSRFNDSSELSNLNTHLSAFLSVSKEMMNVVQQSLKFYKKTAGFFDPRIIGFLECIGYDRDFKSIFCSKIYQQTKEANFFERKLSQDLLIEKNKICFRTRMDFSGIVKGHVTDCASNFLKKRGWNNFLVDSGGDMYFSGRDEKSNVWIVDIEGAPKNKLLIKLLNKGIATSGISRRKWEKNGKRFHHLINPKNPEVFSFDLKSVTVVARAVTEADVLAKTLFLMGKNLVRKYAETKKVPCAILDYRGNVWISSSIKKYLC